MEGVSVFVSCMYTDRLPPILRRVLAYRRRSRVAFMLSKVAVFRNMKIIGRDFDLAVSVGMLEHVTDESVFRRVVSELRRVAKQYIVVVPYRYCWIEPHYGVPFFPILPYSVKVAVVKALNLSNHRAAVSEDPEYINKHFRWLSNARYREAFPDSTIHLLPTLDTIAITRKTEL